MDEQNLFVVRVWCLPKAGQEALQHLHQTLVTLAKSVVELKIESEKDMLVLFPQDLMEYGLGSEILVECFCPFHIPSKGQGEFLQKAVDSISTSFPNATVSGQVVPTSQVRFPAKAK